MKKSLLLTLVVSLALVLVCIPASARTFISIATGGTGGTYYPLGGGMAEIFNNNLEDVNATAEVSGASVENCRLIQKGQVELAMVQNNITFYAVNGTELFDEKMENLRGIAMLYPEIIQIVTTKDTGIKTVEDFKGKRIAVGAPGSGTEADARHIIEAHGLTYDDMTVDYLSFAEAVDSLKDGHVDAAFLTGGVPTAAVMDLAATHDVQLVEVANEYINKLQDKYPFYTKINIPAGTYSGLDETVQTVTVQAMLISNKNVDEDLIYNLTKSLFNNLNKLGQIHAKGKNIKLHTALLGMPIELHNGAQRFFREEYKDIVELLGY